MDPKKRKAASDLPRSTRSNPQPGLEHKQQKHLATIETLDPLDYRGPLSSLTVQNLADAFPQVSQGQQHIDLWTTFSSPNFSAGSSLSGLFLTWKDLRMVSMEQLIEWRHGTKSNGLPQWKPSGAQIATRFIKRLRALGEGLSIDINQAEVRRECLSMELDYMVFMYATQLNNLDNMIPGHRDRVDYLVGTLRSTIAVPQPARPLLASGSQEAPEGADWALDTAMGFEETVDPKLPEIIGHKDVREKFDAQFRIPLLLPHLLRPDEQVGFQFVLLFGPPGTGKTLLARSLAANHGMTFYRVRNDALTSKYVGDTEKILAALGELAIEHKPCIIFFDEIDGLARGRKAEESSYDRRTKNELLEMFNRLSHEPTVLIVGATNRPWDIDAAFLSRFQRKVYLGMPEKEDYIEMLAKSLQGLRSSVEPADLDLLCTFVYNYSGREVTGALRDLRMSTLKELTRSTSFAPVIENGETHYEPCAADFDSDVRIDRPFEEWPITQLVPRAVTRDDIQTALLAVRPAVTQKDMLEYRNWADQFGVGSV